MADSISDIHLALEPLLRPYFARDRWQIDTVPMPLSLGEFTRLMRMTAWIGVGWEQFRPAPGGGRQLLGNHDLTLTMCVKNNAGIGPRLLGDRLGPGLYPSLVTAAVALHGRTVEDVGTLQVTSVAQSYADGYGDLTAAIGVVKLTCNTKLSPPFDTAADAPDFARLVSAFELQPPADGRGPVTDTIDLPGASAP